eukprot:COSAG02_NODE_405_length_23022_cov_14.617764_17_plen_148_part_00
MRSDNYLAITPTQHRQLSETLQSARRQAMTQHGAGLHSGRGMYEQQDMPQGLHHVRVYVRKHGDRPGYYTTLAHMADPQGGGGEGSALDRFGSAALGASGVVAGAAGLSAATGIGLPASIVEGGLAAGLGAVGGIAKGADMLFDAFE